jgi:hypothetical protein
VIKYTSKLGHDCAFKFGRAASAGAGMTPPAPRNAPTVRGDPTGLKCGMTHALQVTLITAEMTAGMLLVLGLIWVVLK